MRKMLMASTTATMAAVYAAKGAAPTPPAAPVAPVAGEVPTAPVAPVAETPATAETPKPKTERVAPQFAAVRTDLQMPTRSSGGGRGSKSAYDFYAIPVGGSLAVLNKSAAQLSSIISNVNKKAIVPATNADGSPKMKMVEMKDQAGNVISSVPSNEPDAPTIKGHWFAVDCGADDPDKAKARIWRDK